MVLKVLPSFYFESRACYVFVILLQHIRRLSLYTLPFLYFFQVLFYLLYIYFHSRVIELSGDVEKNLIKVSPFVIGTLKLVSAIFYQTFISH